MAKRSNHGIGGGPGWHLSRYLIFSKIPELDGFAVLDLYKGSFAVLTSIELYLLSAVEELDPAHPALEKFRKYGFIVDFDQTAALDAFGRSGCGHCSIVSMTICPTMGCNFDCPYCFEDHRVGKMSLEVQEQIVTLAKKMLRSFGARELKISWFGGEPLLAPDVIDGLSEKLMTMARSEGVKYSAGIITNGYLLDEKNASMLGRCQIKLAQVTLDGVGEMHDRTRHLAGGGGTFAQICKNLRSQKLPFKVLVRHNVYQDNPGQMELLEALVKRMAEESGNDLHYYATLVYSNEVFDRQENTPDLMQEFSEIKELALNREAQRYIPKHGIFCTASSICDVRIDDMGRLYKCDEEVDKPDKSFGMVSSWDPDRPIESAERPDFLTRYMNTCCPMNDQECRECLWLPLCCGGCPRRHADGEKVCYPFKDDQEAFALAVYRTLREKENNMVKG